MRNLLLVEDDIRVARLLAQVLAQHDYSADVVGTGREAIDLAAEQIYAAILLDWGLPDIDGLDVVRQLRHRRLSTPVLMVSARASASEIASALRSGADDYLVKPYDTRVLLARIDALLRRTGLQRRALHAGGIEVSLSTHEVSVGPKQIALTQVEFRLLLVLLDHLGGVVPRSVIMTAVWGCCHEGASNALDVHVCHLREKLRESRTTIETVRRVGYRLRETDNGR